MWDIDEGLIAAMPSVWGPVQLGLGRLEGPLHIDPLPCRRGDISPAYRGDRFELREGVVILDAQLFEGVGHDLSRHADVTLAVLEAHVRSALPSGGPAWLRAGLALDRAQAVLPEVSMVRADWERALGLDLGAEPRGGVAVVSAIRERGLGTLPEMLAWLEHGKVPTRAFVDAMVWLCRKGLKEHLARTPSLPAAEDIPLELTPWRAVPLCIPANRRGGKIRVEAGGAGWCPLGPPVVVCTMRSRCRPAAAVALCLTSVDRLDDGRCVALAHGARCSGDAASCMSFMVQAGLMWCWPMPSWARRVTCRHPSPWAPPAPCAGDGALTVRGDSRSPNSYRWV